MVNSKVRLARFLDNLACEIRPVTGFLHLSAEDADDRRDILLPGCKGVLLLDVKENRIFKLLALNNFQEGNSLCCRFCVVTLELCVLLADDLSISCADDGKVYLARFLDSFPVDCAVVTAYVDSGRVITSLGTVSLSVFIFTLPPFVIH